MERFFYLYVLTFLFFHHILRLISVVCSLNISASAFIWSVKKKLIELLRKHALYLGSLSSLQSKVEKINVGNYLTRSFFQFP